MHTSVSTEVGLLPLSKDVSSRSVAQFSLQLLSSNSLSNHPSQRAQCLHARDCGQERDKHLHRAPA